MICIYRQVQTVDKLLDYFINRFDISQMKDMKLNDLFLLKSNCIDISNKLAQINDKVKNIRSNAELMMKPDINNYKVKLYLYLRDLEKYYYGTILIA